MTSLALTMPLVRRLVPMVVALIVFVTVIELIRRRKFREEYAMLWLLASAVMLVFAIFPGAIIHLQEVLQTNYLTIVMLSGFAFLALIILHLTSVLTSRADDVRRLAQSVALLEKQLRELRESHIDPAGTNRDEH
ncbi:MAG: DUF2304 domain-containing protein [Planctomycetota bacterium]